MYSIHHCTLYCTYLVRIVYRSLLFRRSVVPVVFRLPQFLISALL